MSNLNNHYIVLDLETTIKELHKRKASPWHPDNWVVAAGWRFRQGDRAIGAYYGEDRHGADGLLALLLDTMPKLLVGHNIKFDILHLIVRDEANYKAWMKWVAAGGLVWDTQLAEYMLRGMVPEAQMLPLDEVAPTYGGTVKIDEVKAYWEQGVDTHLIPRKLLMDYLTGREGSDGDIDNTEKVLLGQLTAAREMGMLNSLRLNMGALVASIEFEKNGLHVDKALGLEQAARLKEEISALSDSLHQYLPKGLPFEFNWGSPKQKSALFFGGTVPYPKREWLWTDGTYHWEHGGDEQAYATRKVTAAFGTVGQQYVYAEDGAPNWDEIEREQGEKFERYASGKNAGQVKTKGITLPDHDKPKSRMGTAQFQFKGYAKPRKEWEGSEPGVYSTASAVIEELADSGVPFLEAYGLLQKKTKDLGTYYISTDEKGNSKGMLTLVGDDDIVHGSYNHTSTVTGRLSHSNPNLGNLPRADTSDVKRMFTSRFPGGSSISSDFKTLEIYCQAMLTGDAQLISDLRAGLDMHCARLSTVEGKPYEEVLLLAKGDKKRGIEPIPEWDVKRTFIKRFSFQRAYGAGAPKIARTLKAKQEDVELWIEKDNERYPGIERAFLKLEARVNADTVGTNRWTTHPLMRMRVELKEAQYQTFDGKMYTFRQTTSPDFIAKRGTLASYNPPDLKNYPVQGLGGEWMKAAMWLAVRLFYLHGNFGGLALLVSTVHDALYADSDASVVLQAGAAVHAAMLGASDLIEDLFGTPVPVPVPADTTFGPSMFDEGPFLDKDFNVLADDFRATLRNEFMGGYVPTYLKESV